MTGKGVFSTRTGLIVCIVTLAGLVLRLFRVSHQNIWLDEAATFQDVIVLQSDGLFRLAQTDQVAPLYTMLTSLFVDSQRHSEFAMRLPSVILGTIAIPALYATCLRIGTGGRAALVAATLLVFSPFAIWYAQEARMYSGLLLAAILYVWACWPLTYRAIRVADWVALAIITTFGLMMHHYMVFLMITFGIFLSANMLFNRISTILLIRNIVIWISAQIIPVIMFGAWLYMTKDQLGKFTYFQKENPVLWIPYALFSFVSGLTFGPTLAELRSGPLAAIRHDAAPIALTGIAVGFLGLAGFLTRRVPLALRIWLLTWLIMPLLLACAAALWGGITFNVRYIIIAFPAMIILLALGIDRALPTPIAMSKRQAHPQQIGQGVAIACALSSLVIAGVFGLSLRNHYFDERYGKEQVQPLAAKFQGMPANTILAIDNARLLIPLRFYGAPVPKDAVVIDNKFWARTPEVAIATLRTRLAHHASNVWLITYRPWESDPDRELSCWIEQHGQVTNQVLWSGTSLTAFSAVSLKPVTSAAGLRAISACPGDAKRL